MSIEALSPRQLRELLFRKIIGLVNKPPPSGGVHEKTDLNGKRLAFAFSAKDKSSAASDFRFYEFDFIDVLHTQGLGLAEEEMIEIRTIPVSVGDGIVGTGSNQELIASIGGFL